MITVPNCCGKPLAFQSSPTKMDLLKAEKQRIQHELKRKVQDERERLYVLRPPPSHSTRSDVWHTTHFVHHRSDFEDECNRVTFRTQDRVNEFVACVRCKTVWAHSSTTGTKTLKQHKCPGLVAAVAAPTLAASPVHEQATHARQSLDAKERVTDALADFCAQDLQSFTTVAGQGFTHMIQTVLDVAARYNKRLLVEDLLAEPIDVGENVTMRASSGRALLQRMLQAHLSTGVYTACSLDLWNDDVKQIAYLSTAVHYVTDRFKLIDRTLQVTTLRDEVSCMMITEELYDGLAAFDLDQFNKEQFIAISDSKFSSTEADGTIRPMLYEWHPSVVHEVANFLTRVFIKCSNNNSVPDQQQQQKGRRHPPYYRYYDKAPELFNMIDDCKDLVAYFEHANLQQRLSKPLKQANTHTWSSLLQCLSSVDEMRSEVLGVLEEKGRKVKIARIEKNSLRELITFLSEFKVMTRSLEKRDVPTIHEVVYWRHRLLAHLSINDGEAAVGERGDESVTADSEAIASLKHFLKPIIDEAVLVIEPIHIVAALLDPAQKHRITKFGINKEQIEDGCSQLKKLMKAIGPASRSEIRDADDCFMRPSTKRQRVEPRRMATSQYSDDEEDEDADDDESDDTTNDDTRGEGDANTPIVSLTAQVEAEFEKYMSYVVSKSERQAMGELSKDLNGRTDPRTKRPIDHGFPLLTWWKHVGSSSFPTLARVARSILCIPASSAQSRGRSSSDSDDSDDDEMMAAKCTRLAPSTVNDLMFLRSNRDLQG